jgi:hypothetical protein
VRPGSVPPTRLPLEHRCDEDVAHEAEVAEAAAVVPGCVQPDAQGVRERGAGVERQPDLVERAVKRPGFHESAVGRPLGDEVDDAARLEPAVERRSRALEHLDLLDILELLVGRIGRTPQTVLEIVRRDEAADVETVVGCAEAYLRREAWDIAQRLADRGDAAVGDQLAGDHLHRPGRFLDRRIGLADLRGDGRPVPLFARAEHDDLVVLPRLLLDGLGQCFARQENQGQGTEHRHGTNAPDRPRANVIHR